MGSCADFELSGNRYSARPGRVRLTGVAARKMSAGAARWCGADLLSGAGLPAIRYFRCVMTNGAVLADRPFVVDQAHSPDRERLSA